MKTYSLCILSHNRKTGVATWITNWNQFTEPDDIDWQKVEGWLGEKRNGFETIGYGYVYGHNSRNITNPRNRRILFQTDHTKPKELIND